MLWLVHDAGWGRVERGCERGRELRVYESTVRLLLYPTTGKTTMWRGVPTLWGNPFLRRRINRQRIQQQPIETFDVSIGRFDQ